MKNVYTLLCLLYFGFANAQTPKAVENFYVDYSIANFDDTTTYWRLNSRDNSNDSMDVRYAAVSFKGPLQGYYDPTDIENTLNYWNYYYNPITFDSLFAQVNHTNTTGLMDTIVFELVKLNVAFIPTTDVVWSDTIFTDTSLANIRLAIAPNYTTNNNQRVGVNLKYFGATQDTFMLAAGAVVDTSMGFITQSAYNNSWTDIAPHMNEITRNANIGYGSPVGSNGWFEAQNWKLSAYVTYNYDGWGVGVAENALAQTKLYPNPATNLVQLQLPNTIPGSLSIQILNSLGQLVKAEVVTNASGKTLAVDVSTLPAGLYLLQLQNGGAVKGFRVVVAK